jgi:hypothetical protein
VLSKYGLFLIVADNKMGIIEGNPSNTFVTHYTDGVNKYIIKNPYIDCRLLQNEFKKAFASKYKSIECYSYRVYSDKCRLSLPYTTELLTQESLLYTIKQHQKICLSDDEVKNLACSLMEHTVSSKRYMQNINVYLKSLDDNKIEQIPRQWVY